MDSTEMIFCYAIAILYPCFFYKLANNLTGYNEVSSMCNKYHNYYSLNDDDIKYKKSKKCYAEKDKELEKVEFNRHIMLIFLALVGIILTSVIHTNSTKLGIGMGGIFTLIFALYLYWSKYNETTKLMIYGASLLIVIFLSVRIYKIDNIADIFSIEFGTK